ncbi:SPOR domain-containing protein [Corallibacter vietnamensis]
MIILRQKFTKFFAFTALMFYCGSYAQNGSLSINQDQKIDKLLAIKKDINTSENGSDRYKIQIFSGNRDGATTAIRNFKDAFSKWKATDVYETPNYKVWIGNFRTRLEADRALVEIQKKFPNAFRFKPKKEKEIE